MSVFGESTLTTIKIRSSTLPASLILKPNVIEAHVVVSLCPNQDNIHKS